MRAENEKVVWQGVVAGLIGYATVAVMVGLSDVIQGRSFFYTAALLGEWLFYGLTDPGQVVVWPGAVFAYNGVHLLTFLAFGLGAAWIAAMSERGPLFWYAGLVLFLLAFMHLFGAVLLMTEGLRHAIPSYEIWVPCVAATIAIGAYLLAVHPTLRHDLRIWTDET